MKQILARLILSCLLSVVPWGDAHGQARNFLYDAADQTLTSTMLQGQECYDPDVAADDGQLWITWLRFVPGEGDQIWIGHRQGNDWAVREQVAVKAAKLARPTLTFDAQGQLWLSYEAFESDDQTWDVFIRRRIDEAEFGPPHRVSPGEGVDIDHRVAADPTGGLWIVWQTDIGGQFDVTARRVDLTNGLFMTDPDVISQSPRGDWRPDVSVAPDGGVCVVWDAYDGESFNVLARWTKQRRWQPSSTVAATPAFEGRARVVCTGPGQAWVAWEEGGTEWGKPYRADAKAWANLTDTYGPLHRFRKLHVALLREDGRVQRPVAPLPMPNLDHATARENRWQGAHALGTYYERAALTVDGDGRLWVVYRHVYRPQFGVDIPAEHHIEEGWQVFARCLDGDKWSKLYAMDAYQRDGIQRLGVTACGTGVAAAWTTGRTDRRKDPKPRGVAFVVVNHPPGKASDPLLEEAEPLAAALSSIPIPDPLATAKVGQNTYHLVRGDLHRHTDLSLCWPFLDGSIDDAYRLAIEVDRMDFLGITDHTRDIAHGDVLSQLWWRRTKEVTRHRLGGKFFPYFSYERSHGTTDHNVISLRDDRIRDFPPPLPEFWTELERDTFTIPHAPVNMRCWDHQDDALRPLLEIYQGCRDISSQWQAKAGLDKGYHLGFIASSDHLSTGASYACVWTPRIGREPIFRSMQARRTFGATDNIRLVFTSGDHWMGEEFTADEVPRFRIEIDGTAPIEQVVVYDNGLAVQWLEVSKDASSIHTTFGPQGYFGGSHYIYVHMIQTDGNQAWSSPIWVTYANPHPPPEDKYEKTLAEAANLALGKSVTASFSDPSAGSLDLVTDGKINGHLGHGDGDGEWVQVDLGRVEEIGLVRIWHYWRDARAYRGNRVALSVSGEFAGEETVIFDSQADGMYPETERGQVFVIEPVRARYIRNWLVDNTANASRQWVEIEAYAPLPENTP